MSTTRRVALQGTPLHCLPGHHIDGQDSGEERDNSAAIRTWLDGDQVLSRANGATQREAISLLQRALVKIGAHHPDATALPSLLQLPWGADGDCGPSTIAALNAAMLLAGRPDLADHRVENEIKREG